MNTYKQQYFHGFLSLMMRSRTALLFLIITLNIFYNQKVLKQTIRQQDKKEQLTRSNSNGHDMGMSINLYIEKERVLASSPIAKIANKLIHGNGILVRTRDVSEDKDVWIANKSYLPASFIHASMRAPNLMYNFRQGYSPAVGVLVGTKFTLNVPQAIKVDIDIDYSEATWTVGEAVDCRAYYPLDCWSKRRNHLIKNNPLGTSCLRPYQGPSSGTRDLYNLTNG